MKTKKIVGVKLARGGGRNSSFELLRIICIYGIISLHSFGNYQGTVVGVDRVYSCFIEAIFNMGCTLFMLISGYFGINFSIKKLIHLLAPLFFYSLINCLLSFYFGDYFSKKELLFCFFNLFTNKYWFATSYIIIFLISKVINNLVSNTERKTFRNFLIVLIIFFVVAPTLLLKEILNDAGKGVINMLLVYMVGRYIKIYNLELSKIRAYLFSLISISVTFIITLFLSIHFKKNGGVLSRFCFDSSLFIFVSSIFTFFVFKNMNFNISLINILASAVFAIYLFESSIRLLILNIFGKNIIIFNIVLYNIFSPMVVIFFGFMIESLRKIIFGKFENTVIHILETKFVTE